MFKTTAMTQHTLSIAVLIALGGCATAGAPEGRLGFSLPTDWFSGKTAQSKGLPVAAETGAALSLKALPTDRWWTAFNDPALSALMDKAVARNSDLRLAVARLQEAQANFSFVRADQFPAVGVGINSNRTRSTQLGTNPLPQTFSPYTNSTRLSLQASWELDLWGKLANATEAARNNLLATQASQEAIKLAVTAQTAQLYYGLIGLNEQAAIARATQTGREQAYALQKQRFDAGLSSEFELRQVEADLAAVAAQRPVIEQQRDAAENALKLLTGEEPGAFMHAGAMQTARTQTLGQLIPEGVSSELLRRRPDIRQAEYNLQAADATVAVAKASYFPSIGLTSFFGGESADLGNLFKGPARTFQFAGSVTQPIFQGGKLYANEDIAKARQSQALIGYQDSIRVAFREVADALGNQYAQRERWTRERQRVAALEQSVRLAKLRLEQGVSSQLDLLDAQRNLLQAQLNEADAWQASQAATVGLIKAMGGGWSDPVK